MNFMLPIAASIFAILLLVWLATRLIASLPAGQQPRWTVYTLLVAMILIMAYFSVYADRFLDGNFPWLMVALFPLFLGFLSTFLVRWREVFAIWRQDRLRLSILLLVALALVASWGRFSGGQPPYAPFVIVLIGLLIALFWGIAMRLSPSLCAFLTAFMALFFFLDATGMLTAPTFYNLSLFRAAYNATLSLTGALSLVLCAVMVHRFLSREDPHPWLAPALVAVLLLAFSAAEFRHGALTKATGRAFEDHIPAFPLIFSIVTDMLMFASNRGSSMVITLAYSVLVPGLLAAGFTFGWFLDAQGITVQRAERMTQAIERYHQDSGEYPSSLRELTPRYLEVALGPLTGRGQVWCYQGGLDFYRLGYLYFQRYYRWNLSPYYEIRIHATAGELPDGPWMCDQELEKHGLFLGF